MLGLETRQWPEVLEDFEVETIYFLVFIGVCAFVVVWATRKSSSKTDLKARPARKRPQVQNDKLFTPVDNPLSHKREAWERRRKHATEGIDEKQSYVPKSVAASAPEYDGYSRRDRHHLTKTGAVKKETPVEEEHGLKMSSIDFKPGEHAPQS